MIERFYLKDCLSFKEIELEFEPGLVVFSGASGSGKSVLMSAILASLGLCDAVASVSECSVDWQVDESESGLLNDTPNTLRSVKKSKNRYFFNNQSISKSALKKISLKHLRFLSLKDYSDFHSSNLLDLVDAVLLSENRSYAKTLKRYRDQFVEFKTLKLELESMRDLERSSKEREEFARFELSKIESIDPKISEYEECLDIKKSLSKKEKLEHLLLEARAIFDSESSVSSLLDELDIESAFFDESMNELRAHFESIEHKFVELEDVDIEQILDRLEKLSELKNRYGSIEEAIAYKEQKLQELSSFETLEQEIVQLEKRVDTHCADLNVLASDIGKLRKSKLESINSSINAYLQQLYLDGATLVLNSSELDESGGDRAELRLMGRALQECSQGEFNRLRLALLALKSESMHEDQGTLILDEIDANLSGEESMSVAKVLKLLSRHFQIFVISHQPQLTALGEQHFLVKKDITSEVIELKDSHMRIEEIARIVSGEHITSEARELARSLLNSF